MILVSTFDVRETVDMMLYDSSKFSRSEKRLIKNVVAAAVDYLVDKDKCVEATTEQHLKLLDGKLKEVNGITD